MNERFRGGQGERPASPETGKRFLEAAKRLVGNRQVFEGDLSGGRNFSIELATAQEIERGEPAISLMYIANNEKESYTTIDYRAYEDGRVERIVAIVPEQRDLFPKADTPESLLKIMNHQREVVEMDEQLQRESGGTVVTESELLAFVEELEQLH